MSIISIRHRALLLALVIPLTAPPAGAQERPDTARLKEVTVFGSRADLGEARRDIARQPGGVAMIEPARLRATRQANLKDALRFVPGVYVAPRFGAADESQISIRGSGLRNNFHARGINLLVNGMPYRNADGFTDFESLELMNTEAIQVYKGGNAFRFGGATLGGAVNLLTRTGLSSAPIEATAEAGGYGFFKGQVASGGASGPFNYFASYSRTDLDGYRDWSRQSRDRVNAHVGYRLGPATDLRTFYFFAHVTERLPGALTRSEFESAPRSAVAGNMTDRWGRNYDLHHVGMQLRHQLSPSQRIEISPYFQYRDIDHPIFQVISQTSSDLGAELRYENSGAIGGVANRLTAGVQPAGMWLTNRQYVNQAGQHGELRKDQRDRAGGIAFYAEDAFSITPKLTLVAGGRYDRQIRRTEDHFLADGDQTARRVFEGFLPRAGILFQAGGETQLFANLTRSLEPPLLLELNSLAVPGFVDLDGQRAWQFETGVRGRRGLLAYELSLYDIELRDEIVNQNVQPFPNAPFTVPTYRNAERTRHSGIEAGIAWTQPLNLFTARDGGDGVTFEAAYTFGRFRYLRDAEFSGHDIPGAPRHVVHAALRYLHPAGVTIAPTIEWVPGSYYVNSANTERNQGWTFLGARADLALLRSRLTLFIAGENLTGTRASPSVQVDNAVGRFFEPADGRTLYAGLRWSR